VSRVHGTWTTGTPVHHGPAAIAALGSSPELGLQPLRCPRAPIEGQAGKLNGGVATAREAVEGRLTGDGNLGSEGQRRGLGERALEVWDASPGAGSAFIGRRRGRASSMTGVEGASLVGVEGAGYRLLKRGNGVE
jgi:hypothetical protein